MDIQKPFFNLCEQNKTVLCRFEEVGLMVGVRVSLPRFCLLFIIFSLCSIMCDSPMFA